MHDVLRQRLMRRIESLPDDQVYQVLDFIEFLESKYARDLQVESTGLQRFAEGLEDRIRRKALNPATLREAFQLISAADRVLSGVSTAGRQILSDLGSLADASPGAESGSVDGGRTVPPRSNGGGVPGPSDGSTDAPDHEREEGSGGS